MGYIKVPISYTQDNSSVLLREIEDKILMIDNFIELLVFTPRGSFLADADFGFEYWNHEYSNVNNRAFNSGQNGAYVGGLNNEITRRECQDSMRRSLELYVPSLKHVEVDVELSSIDDDTIHSNSATSTSSVTLGSTNDSEKIRSKRKVSVVVTGILDDGLGTFAPYRKDVSFFIEPTVRV